MKPFSGARVSHTLKLPIKDVSPFQFLIELQKILLRSLSPLPQRIHGNIATTRNRLLDRRNKQPGANTRRNSKPKRTGSKRYCSVLVHSEPDSEKAFMFVDMNLQERNPAPIALLLPPKPSERRELEVNWA